MTQHKRIYTIGHSTHSLEAFITLLQKHTITCLVDVRSMPASAYVPQFNQATLSAYLSTHAITYLYLGTELGAKQTNTEIFHGGISRLQKGVAKGFRIALMCAESDPLKCHRFSLIAENLSKQGFIIEHILKDGSLLTHPRSV